MTDVANKYKKYFSLTFLISVEKIQIYATQTDVHTTDDDYKMSLSKMVGALFKLS